MSGYRTYAAGQQSQQMYTSTDNAWGQYPPPPPIYQSSRPQPTSSQPPTVPPKSASQQQIEACLRRLNSEQLARFRQLSGVQQQQLLQHMMASSPPSPQSPGSQSDDTSVYSTSPSSPSDTRVKGKYICLYPECLGRGFGRLADLQRHDDRIHHPDTGLIDCPEPGCDRVGARGLPRMDKLRDHLRDKHKRNIPKTEKGAKKGKGASLLEPYA